MSKMNKFACMPVGAVIKYSYNMGEKGRRAAGKGVYALTLIISVIGLILGFMMLLSPLVTLAAIRCFAGAYFILLGANGILLAFSPMGTGR